MDIKLTAFPLIAALGVFGAAPAGADSACKGLPQNACQGSASCSWVNGYTRKDGREVAPYCRVKSSGKSAAGNDAKSRPAG